MVQNGIPNTNRLQPELEFQSIIVHDKLYPKSRYLGTAFKDSALARQSADSCARPGEHLLFMVSTSIITYETAVLVHDKLYPNCIQVRRPCRRPHVPS